MRAAVEGLKTKQGFTHTGSSNGWAKWSTHSRHNGGNQKEDHKHDVVDELLKYKTDMMTGS